MTDPAATITTFRRRWGLSQRRLARLLGVNERTVPRWEAGSLDPPPPVLLALRLIDERGGPDGVEPAPVRLRSGSDL